jgi:muramoyltetrapeptide carboxypeptidase
LQLAGKLSSVAGVLVGSFSYDEGDQAESASDVDELLREFLAPLGAPVLAGFPAGHERFNLSLPMGARVEIDADQRCVKVLERPVE